MACSLKTHFAEDAVVNWVSANNAKAKEANCVSKSAIKAHDGKCGKKNNGKNAHADHAFLIVVPPSFMKPTSAHSALPEAA